MRKPKRQWAQPEDAVGDALELAILFVVDHAALRRAWLAANDGPRYGETFTTEDLINGQLGQLRSVQELKRKFTPEELRANAAKLRVAVEARAKRIVRVLGADLLLQRKAEAVAVARRALEDAPVLPPELKGLTQENFGERMEALDRRAKELSRKLGRLATSSELGPGGLAFPPGRGKQLRKAIARQAGVSDERDVRRTEQRRQKDPRMPFMADDLDIARRRAAKR